MATKNIAALSFNYTMWGCCVTEDKMTTSKAKMKKIIADDIKNTLANGYKKHGEKESPLSLNIPFFNPICVTDDMKIKIDFSTNCKFKCEKFSNILKTRTEYGEVTMDGIAKVTIVWKR